MSTPARLDTHATEMLPEFLFYLRAHARANPPLSLTIALGPRQSEKWTNAVAFVHSNNAFQSASLLADGLYRLN